MRVMLIADGDLRREYGGGEVYVRNLLEALTAAGHAVKVANDPGAIAQEKPDIVHAHGLKAAAARIARASGLPCIVTMHHGGLVCPQGALLDWEDRICHRPVDQGLCTGCCLRGRTWGNVTFSVGRFLRRLPNIPFITPAMVTPLTVAEKREEIASLVRDVTMFVAPSAAAQQALVRNGVPRERTVVVAHGIKPLTRRPMPAPTPLRFAYVARINRSKGFHVLLDAFQRLEGNCELHVIGAAHNKRERRYLGGLTTPPRVIFHNHLTGDALAAAWAQCAVTVLPSICLEVFGLVIPESFSLGRPVIVTDCGGPAELVRTGVDGFVVPPNDPVALAAAMRRFVDDPSLSASMASRLPPARTMAQHVQDLERVYALSRR